jgi:hypothetical protein
MRGRLDGDVLTFETLVEEYELEATGPGTHA